jgi:O-antigen ligase
MAIKLINLLLLASVLAPFLLGFRQGVASLIIMRPLCDRFFDAERVGIAGHQLSYGAIINMAVIGLTVLNWQRIRMDIPPKLRNVWLPFVLVSLVATLYSPTHIDALRKSLTYFSFSSLFMFSFVIVSLERDASRFLKLIILSSVLPVAYGLFQGLSGIDRFLDSSRVASTFSHPNIFAFYIVSTLGTILFVLCTQRVHITPKLRFILHIYIVPLLVALVMTKTRSAWLGAMILLLVYALIYDGRILIFGLSIPIVVLLVPAVHDRIMALMTGNEYSGWVTRLNSYAWREFLWQHSYPYIWKRPIFGYGTDSFLFYSKEFFPLGATEAHNVYIQILFEAGIVGLIAFGWIYLRSAAWLFSHWRFDKRGISMAFAILGTYLLVCYSDNMLAYLSFDWCFWFSFGLMVAQIGLLRSPSQALPKPLSFRRDAKFAKATAMRAFRTSSQA